MIVVIDTNVWISALLNTSGSSKPLQATIKGLQQHIVAISSPIQDEIVRVLTQKFRWDTTRAQNTLAEFLPLLLSVEVYGNLHVCRDPDDDIILECAINAHAEVIVTGDKDLLTLQRYEGIRILTPAEYLELSE